MSICPDCRGEKRTKRATRCRPCALMRNAELKRLRGAKVPLPRPPKRIKPPPPAGFVLVSKLSGFYMTAARRAAPDLAQATVFEKRQQALSWARQGRNAANWRVEPIY